MSPPKNNATTQTLEEKANLAAPKTRVSGRVWKTAKRPTIRTTMPRILKKSWEEKSAERAQKNASHKLHQEMKLQYETERQVKRDHIKERKRMRIEKERQDQYLATLSARKKMKLKRKELKAKAHAKH
ncbi:hypothetical protein BB561_001810 [Smittium simulii]|uniref:rRNA-processing protein n=1 Tax=Smittium simulii TaxID=133385 RepID=A0A2T9YT59_9FUNG|nr:hypothetical protein BB561_001810 [Smittium simulii]